jgi:hypothetical protein
MSVINFKFRPGLGVTLDKINKILNQITAKSSFSLNELRAKVGIKYMALI